MHLHFLDALSCKNSSPRPPVWLMRQAGRYMHEYRAFRKKHTFLDICYNEDLICQVTKMPIDAFGFDAAIVFSDILLLVQALGVGLSFEEGSGPKLSGLHDLQIPNEERIYNALKNVYSACSALKKELSVPLIGFAGAPFTLLCYLVEGKSNPGFVKTIDFLNTNQDKAFQILLQLKDAVIFHLNEQLRSGCDAVQLFDTWMGLLPENVLDMYVEKIVSEICKNVQGPVIFFSKSISDISIFQKIQARGFSLPCDISLQHARDVLGKDAVLQGNLDPLVLLGNEDSVEKEVKRIASSMQSDPGFIFNLAHGILPNTPRNNVEVLVQTIKNM